MRSTWQKVGSAIGFSILALLLIGAMGAIWGALIYGNIRTTPSIPWALPALVVLLWAMWQYLGGKGWPVGTSLRRKLLLRANPVSRPAMVWSVAAGLLAIGALAGFWIVMFQLVRMHANFLLPALFTSSPVLIAAIIAGASLLAPITEESAVRGYLQKALEREFTPLTAVLLSSLVFALAHVTQGLAWPKLLFYFLVGITFGALAYLNDSILPVIPVHIAADLIFFILIWPHDSARRLIWQSGADHWFWLHVAQTIGLAAVSVITFRQLRRVSLSAPTQDAVPRLR